MEDDPGIVPGSSDAAWERVPNGPSGAYRQAEARMPSRPVIER